MALNVNAALMQLDPLKPLGPLPDKRDQSMQLEQLKLMRERFEEEKSQNAQNAEWRKIAEAGAMTREQMASDRQAQHDQELAIAENIKQRTGAFDSFNKRVDSGDYEGMDLDATRINELGGLAELTGRDENGFPSYRIEFDAEAARKRDAEQEDQTTAFFDDSDDSESSDSRLPRESTAQSLDRLNALGYDTLGLRGNLAGTGVGEGQPLSTEDAFAAAQRAARGPDEAAALEPEAPPEDTAVSQYDLAGEADAAKNFLEPGRSTPMAPPPQLEPSIFQATGRPARGPDQRDIMGGVPKNVIDTGSMQDQRKQRLGPVMDNLVKGMPQAYQAETQANNDAALAMGLPADKTMAEARANRGLSETALRDEQQAKRAREAAVAKALADENLGPKERQQLVDMGRNAGRQSYRDQKVHDSVGVMEGADQVTRMLSDKDAANDDKAINLMMDLAKQVGAQSDADALRMTGGKINRWDKIKEWMHEEIEGGFGDQVKASMKQFAKDMRERQKAAVFSWMDATADDMDNAEHPLIAKGYKQLLDRQPQWLLDEYAAEHPDKGGAAADDGGEPPDDSAADYTATTPRYREPVRGAADGPPIDDYEQAIPKESRIAYVHKNPGNLMYDKDNPAGAEPGEDKEGGGKWARFPTVQAGFEALRGYITRHDDETIHDFIARYAPASDGNDTEKYIADAVRELKAEPDDTVYNIDPYDLMRFIVRHESGTNMPYQYDAVDEKNRKLEEKAGPAPERQGETTLEPAGGGGADDDKFEGID